MAHPPGTPNSQSVTSQSQSAVTSEDSDDSLVTPRPGPASQFERTSAYLSQPSIAETNTQTELDNPPEGLSRNPRTGNSDVFNVNKLQKPLDRLTSVSFSSSTSVPKPSHLGSYRMQSNESRSSNVSPHGGAVNRVSEEHEAGESSADENTAIMKPRSRQGYGATDGEGREETNTEVMNGSQKKWSQSSRSKGNRASRSGGEVDPTGKQGDDEKEGWWKSFVDKYGSVELENKGSTARDHLALERTFLAWLRTSLSFASIGVAITQLFRLNSSLAPSGNSGTSSMSPNPSSGLLTSPVNIAIDDSTSSPTYRLRQVGKPLGATFLGISIVILLLGFHRYFESQHYVIRGKFPASRGSILIVTFVAAALIIASLVIVVTVAPTALNT